MKSASLKNAFIITLIYFVFGALFVVYMSNSERVFFQNILLGFTFLVLSSVIFFFAVNLMMKKSENSGAEKEIEEYKIKNEELYQDKVCAEVMNAAKSQFLSNMSQEIRIPMSGIIGMTELMMLTNLTKEQKEYLDIINFSSTTLLAIINNILDFSRIESGKLKLENTEFNIKDLVHKTSQILDFEARRKKVLLKLDADPNINYNVFGDPLRINQIVINLTKNAIKSTERGTVSISLAEKSHNDGKAVLVLTIADTGEGFSKEIFSSMFGVLDDNGRVKLNRDFEYTGVGFGIPIVKHLTALFGGDMYVFTETSKGSKIIIELPFVTAEKTIKKEEPSPKADIKNEEPQTMINKEVNVLVAEDNLVNQRLVRELLTRKNYKVTIVENGLKIFDLLETVRFDVILMDIQMPIMDGLEATSIIREIEKGTGKHIPIIGITAYAVQADRDKCLSVGMDDYMSKPFVKEEFYKMIEKYINI
ncbi:MAG: response regulator [Ignavibacteria bacterium]|nr:response regulator [Ignavibacteria bacterium]